MCNHGVKIEFLFHLVGECYNKISGFNRGNAYVEYKAASSKHKTELRRYQLCKQ